MMTEAIRADCMRSARVQKVVATQLLHDQKKDWKSLIFCAVLAMPKRLRYFSSYVLTHKLNLSCVKNLYIERLHRTNAC